MIKKVLTSTFVLRNLLTEEQFNQLIDYFNLELFQLQPKRKYVFLDEAGEMRKKLSMGSMMFTITENGIHFLFLQILLAGGTMQEWKDVLYESEYEQLMEEQNLPTIDHSNVTRKLHDLRIISSKKFVGSINSESADATRQLPFQTSANVKVHLERISFDDNTTDHHLVIGYESIADAQNVLDKILQDNNIKKGFPKSNMERFYEVLDAQKTE